MAQKLCYARDFIFRSISNILYIAEIVHKYTKLLTIEFFEPPSFIPMSRYAKFSTQTLSVLWSLQCYALKTSDYEHSNLI